MVGNDELHPVKEQRHLSGFGNLFRQEVANWWQTPTWLVQFLLWTVLINALMAFGLFANAHAPDILLSSPEEQVQIREFQVVDALNLFFTVGTIVLPMVAALFGQETLLEESDSGAAAWILSKPISRAAYVLAKVAAHSLSILATMVVFPGALAYLLFWLARFNLPWWGMSAAMGLIFLNSLFFLCLATLVGLVAKSRGAALGVTLALALGSRFILPHLPWLQNALPWGFTYDVARNMPAQLISLAQGQPLINLLPVIATLGWVAAFLILSLRFFGQQEFL